MCIACPTWGLYSSPGGVKTQSATKSRFVQALTLCHTSNMSHVHAIDGVVYFLVTEDQKYLKIGFTRHKLKRINALQNGCPLTLTLVKQVRGNYGMEQLLLNLFDELRVHGEWFRFELPLARFVASLTDDQILTPIEILRK